MRRELAKMLLGAWDFNCRAKLRKDINLCFKTRERNIEIFQKNPLKPSVIKNTYNSRIWEGVGKGVKI